MRLGSWAAFVAAAVIVTEASATTMLRVELDELTRSSELVVRGKVERTESHWSQDGMRIFTEVEIAVEEAFKGKKPGRLLVHQPGGVVDDIGQKVSGLATFERGEEVVLFLTRRGNGYQVTGLGQGKFRVERSTDGKAAFAIPERLDDALILDRQTRQPVRRASDPLTLEELVREIRAAQAAAPGKPGTPEKKAP